MNQSVSPARCVGVAGVATGLWGALAAFLLPDLGGAVALRAAPSTPVSFEELLVDGCAVAALLAATWLWAVTCAIALLAARGRPEAAPRRVPVVVRRLVLAACGAALAGAVHGPAGAAPGGSPRSEPHGTAGAISVAGLPLPDRALGAPVVVVRPGDTLWDLAAAHLPPGAGPARVTACWHRIHELNRDVIGEDPDLILPGQRLHLPPR
jgi:nucleoid-associated protein YgaU